MSLNITNNFNKKNKNLYQKKIKYFNNFFAELKKDLVNENKYFYIFNKLYYSKKDFNFINKFKNYKKIVFIGMGGSTLGIKAFHSFSKKEIKKKIFFLDNLEDSEIIRIKKKLSGRVLFVVISKSGNTIETLSNLSNFKFLISKKNCLIISEKSNNTLYNFAVKKNLHFIQHEKFIGGRFSILSRTGIIILKLLGLKKIDLANKFSNFILNKKKYKKFCLQVSEIFSFYKEKKFNTIVCLAYSSDLYNLVNWFQQLSAESLGKKGNGLTPFLSIGPKDHHSLLQLYLDGPKDKVFYIFDKKEERNIKINNIFGKKYNFFNKRSLNDVKKAQKKALIMELKAKKIPFREIYFKSSNQKTLFDYFIYFIMETILLAKLLGINPFGQPAVETVKINTNKILN